jgi:methionine sulfoxide reductase catalytic subunit
MERNSSGKRPWWKVPFGKRLLQLHRWNAWIILLLALTGLILSIGTIRGLLGEGRVWLKQIHIWAGVVSAILLVMYVPVFVKHLKQLRGKRNQQWNLGIVLGLLVGWIISGVVLWQFRKLPPSWANSALLVHDLLTWVGIPYAIYHSITRMRWVKKGVPKAIYADVSGAVSNRASTAGGVAASSDQAAASSQLESGKMEVLEVDGEMIVRKVKSAMAKRPFYTRREFIQWTVGLGITAAIMPSFLKWLSSSLGTGGSTEDALIEKEGSRMLPPPQPLQDSVNVIGGGSQGDFRVYTVTALPTFSAENWKLTIDGFVDRPMTFNWEQFLALKREVQVSDFHCVTGWSVVKNTWEGIRLSELLKLAGVKPEGKFLKLYSGDGVYTDCLSLKQALMEDVMVVVLHDGKPIPQQLGGPVRLIVPKMYAYKSVKWLERIELIDQEHMGYWEVRGYDNDAWVGSSNRA